MLFDVKLYMFAVTFMVILKGWRHKSIYPQEGANTPY